MCMVKCKAVLNRYTSCKCLIVYLSGVTSIAKEMSFIGSFVICIDTKGPIDTHSLRATSTPASSIYLYIQDGGIPFALCPPVEPICCSSSVEDLSLALSLSGRSKPIIPFEL